MKTSPTRRSLALLRGEGYTVAVVERWNPHARIRQDLFGFADLLAIRPGEIAAVQTTSGSNISARLAKILDAPAARIWLLAGGRIEVHGWSKRGRPQRWAARRREVTMADFASPIMPIDIGDFSI